MWGSAGRGIEVDRDSEMLPPPGAKSDVVEQDVFRVDELCRLGGVDGMQNAAIHGDPSEHCSEVGPEDE